MLFQDLLEFSKTHSIDAISSKIVREIDENNILDLDFIKYIEDEIFSSSDYNFKVKYFEFLFRYNHFENIYILYQKDSQNKMDYVLSKIYLKALFEMGQISKYDEKLRLVFEELLGLKYFSCLDDFINEFDAKLKLKPYYLLGKVSYFIEVECLEKLIIELKQIKGNFYKGIVDLSLLVKLHSILESASIDHEDYSREKLYVKILLSTKQEISFILKEKYDAILLSENKQDSLIASTILEDGSLQKFLQYLKEKENLSLRDFPLILKDSKIKNNFLKNLNPEIRHTEMNECETIQSSDLDSSYVHAEDLQITETYVETDEELSIMRFLFVSDDKKYFTESMAITFMSLRYYKLAYFILNKISLSSNQLYLKAMVALKLKLNSEVVELTNYTLTKFNINNEEAIPFIVLKAMAFKNLGDVDEYNKLQSLIKYINPLFIITKDMWQA